MANRHWSFLGRGVPAWCPTWCAWFSQQILPARSVVRHYRSHLRGTLTTGIIFRYLAYLGLSRCGFDLVTVFKLELLYVYFLVFFDDFSEWKGLIMLNVDDCKRLGAGDGICFCSVVAMIFICLMIFRGTVIFNNVNIISSKDYKAYKKMFSKVNGFSRMSLWAMGMRTKLHYNQ